MTAALTPSLTDRQRATLAFIKAYRREHRFSPSFREIRDAVGVSSISTVAFDLGELEAKQAIRRVDNLPRAIVPTDEAA